MFQILRQRPFDIYLLPGLDARKNSRMVYINAGATDNEVDVRIIRHRLGVAVRLGLRW
jgi:hypothetical protein